MKRHITLFDICRKTGVSTATVSRVINQRPNVLPETHAKVMKAIRELGYHPSHAARILAGQKTGMIGALFPEIAGGFCADILNGIDDTASVSGHHVVATFSRGEKELQQTLATFIRERRVDALVVMNLFASMAPTLEAARREGMVLVLLDRPAPGVAVPTVTMDNIGGADAAVTHLLGLGYRHIAFITGPDDNFDAQQRLEGVRRAFARAGASLPAEMIWPGDFSEAAGRKAVLECLGRQQPMPEAIFACNDAMAIGAMAVLEGHGYRVPEDVAVAGFDDIDAARHLGLTTVHVPRRHMGAAAAGFAIDAIRGRPMDASTVLIPVKLMVRRSTLKAPVTMSISGTRIENLNAGKHEAPSRGQETT